MSRARFGTGGGVLLVLLGVYLAIGIGRLPTRVWQRRFDDVARYRDRGAAEFLLGNARLEGAAAIEWIRHNVAEDEAVLWRWPADGALEFTAALIAPRLLIDERAVTAGTEQHAGRQLARGVIPSGQRGVLIVQGTPSGGLRLLVRED